MPAAPVPESSGMFLPPGPRGFPRWCWSSEHGLQGLHKPWALPWAVGYADRKPAVPSSAVPMVMAAKTDMNPTQEQSSRHCASQVPCLGSWEERALPMHAAMPVGTGQGRSCEAKDL
jgi:hypothetical protein